MTAYLDQALTSLEKFEGVIPWMYRDTVGKVTVGVGLMLPDAAAAERLPFVVDGVAATEAQIAAEFDRVDALPMGRPALFYRAKDKPVLAPETIASLLRTVVAGFEGELRKAITRYDSMPDGVKLALIDMAYNLGPTGLLKGYPRMMRAVEAGAWAQAAAECTRPQAGAARNDWTRAMLLGNVLGKLGAAAESKWKQFGFGLLGAGAALVEKLRGNKDGSPSTSGDGLNE